MKVLVAVIALLAALTVAAGLGVYYWSVGIELDNIRSRLITPEQLQNPDAPETTSGIKLAPMQCARVYDLRADPFARRLRGDEIWALWAHCEHIADMAAGLDKRRKRSP
jgi:hypothetical protein